MKATTQHTLFCECNHALSYVASEAGTLTVLQCVNVRCQHYGKRFQAPTFDLVGIPQAESAQSVTAHPAAGTEDGEGE